MTKTSRFLALLPVVAFAAACSGVAPTGPSQIVSSEPSEAVSGDATATALPCPSLTSISLDVLPSTATFVWVQATYHYSGPGPAMQPCPAPRWTSNRNQLLVDRDNPMRAGFRRSAGGKATVTATALNRVTRTITVSIGPPPRLASSLNVVPIPQACRAIAGVGVKIVPAIDNRVFLVARYLYKKPVIGICSIAPAWEATRRGLTVHPTDPFRASIKRATDVRTTVTATAPNGASGRITF